MYNRTLTDRKGANPVAAATGQKLPLASRKVFASRVTEEIQLFGMFKKKPPPYDQVRMDLDEIVALLTKDGCSWARLFELAKCEFDRANYKACGSIILSGSGGMGSLNDLVLGQGSTEAGEFVWKPGYKELNDRFQVLLGRLYGFAESISSR